MHLRLLSHVNKKTWSSITSSNINPCVQCKHFIPPPQSYYPHEPVEDIKEGKCTLFEKKDVVTKEINNDFAIACRNDKKKCGINGKYFVHLFQK